MGRPLMRVDGMTELLRHPRNPPVPQNRRWGSAADALLGRTLRTRANYISDAGAAANA